MQVSRNTEVIYATIIEVEKQ